MDGGNKESLEERLERIRLRNQEIEKKYREAEEDRLRALKDNAMVEVKSPKHEDWPKEHKYDTLDYTYDVDPALLQEAQPSVQTPADPAGGGRKKKTFTEGDGPPPDPAYNFLADSERDGSEGNNNNNNVDRKRNVPYGGNGGGGGDQGAGFRKSGSFRRQNSSGGGLGGGNNNNNSSNAKGKRDFVGSNAKPTAIANHNNNNNNSDYHGRKPVQFEIQPKKNLETNWRSRDDHPEKTGESSATGGIGPTSPPQRQTSVEHPVIHDDTAIAATYHQAQQQKKPLPLTTPKTQQQAIPIEKLPPALRPIVGNNNNANNQQAPTALRQPITVQEVNPGPPQQQQQPIPEKLMVEQRGNIQFSVSRDGEIQSVKRKENFVFSNRSIAAIENLNLTDLLLIYFLVTSSSRAGTGRVGLPRAITKQSQPPPAPAQIASSVNNGNINNSLPAEAQNPNHFHIPNMAYPPPPVVSQVQVPQPHVEATSSSSNTTAKKFSVQDRLSKFQVPT